MCLSQKMCFYGYFVLKKHIFCDQKKYRYVFLNTPLGFKMHVVRVLRH